MNVISLLQTAYLAHYRSHKALGLTSLKLWEYYDAVFGQEPIHTYFRGGK